MRAQHARTQSPPWPKLQSGSDRPCSKPEVAGSVPPCAFAPRACKLEVAGSIPSPRLPCSSSSRCPSTFQGWDGEAYGAAHQGATYAELPLTWTQASRFLRSWLLSCPHCDTEVTSPHHIIAMDTLRIEPRASRMLSGCDTTTPCAREVRTAISRWGIASPMRGRRSAQ